MLVMVAEPDIHAEARRAIHRSRHTHRRLIDDHGRRMGVINRRGVRDHDWRRCGDVDNLRRSGHVDRGGMHRVTDGMNSGDAGQDFSHGGPFTVTGGGIRDTGGSESGETQNSYRVFHIFIIHFDRRSVGPVVEMVYSSTAYP